MQHRTTADARPVGFVREALRDVARELRDARARAVEVLADVVLLAGALYLLSSVGEDSGRSYDVTDSSTLAAVGVGLLAAGVLLGGVSLLLDAGARRRRRLPSRRRVHAAMAAGTLLALAGAVALLR